MGARRRYDDGKACKGVAPGSASPLLQGIVTEKKKGDEVSPLQSARISRR